MKVRYTRRARNDIAEIFTYIAKDDRAAAQRIQRAIVAAVDLVAARPFVGIKNARAPELRSRLVSRYPYRVHYFVRDEEVLILGVWHTARRPFGSAP